MSENKDNSNGIIIFLLSMILVVLLVGREKAVANLTTFFSWGFGIGICIALLALVFIAARGIFRTAKETRESDGFFFATIMMFGGLLCCILIWTLAALISWLDGTTFKEAMNGTLDKLLEWPLFIMFLGIPAAWLEKKIFSKRAAPPSNESN